jgi:hypothetical protein
MVQSGPDSKLNQTKAIALEDIRLVQDYPDVFPEELPGMPPDHDIEFSYNYYLEHLSFLRGHIGCPRMSW